MLAECLGTEKWFALLGKPRGTVSRVIKEAVKRAGSEFTEEALTEVAQRISDGFVMGEQSEYSAYIRELMKAGLTEAEANAEAFKEFFIKNPLKAGALDYGFLYRTLECGDIINVDILQRTYRF